MLSLSNNFNGQFDERTKNIYMLRFDKMKSHNNICFRKVIKDATNVHVEKCLNICQ